MKNIYKLYLYTFLGIGLVVFFTGYFGINISLKYIQKHYIQLQIDVNKRQAEHMAIFIQNEIKRGIPLDSIRNEFQASIQGTEYDKGFLCMYDTKENQMVCHPDAKALGMKFTNNFIFLDQNTGIESYIGNIYNKDKPAGGIFIQSNIRTDIIYTIPVKGTNWFINAHENINAISKEIKILRFRYILGSLILGLIIAIAASFTARGISRHYEKQIEQKNIEITNQHDKIAVINKEITDSINYAQRIQSAVIPSTEILNKAISDSFVLYKPKSIISGDFYWFGKIDNLIVIVAADCTGHGVPGAFMSMLGVSLLNEIVNHRKIYSAKEILNELRIQVKNSLGQKGLENEQKDGMDIAICTVDIANHQLNYAGANNPLYIIRKNENSSIPELTEIKADRMPVGVHPKDNISFSEHQVKFNPSDNIFIFSDGFVSQFGGEKGETFKSKRLQNLLLSMYNEPMDKQKEKINDALINWQGNHEQVDDILLIGFKV